jgi:tripartite-type tricarboxylate transporter receptor subunit TctC
MINLRVRFALLFRLGLMLSALSVWAADEYPSKPIRLVVPVTAGSGLDVRARYYAQVLGQHLGWKIVVENKPGAGQSIGIAYVANAAPDGYTLVAVNNNITLNPHLYATPGYDLFKGLAPITQTNATPLVLVVNPSSDVKTVKELVARGKAKPEALTYASSGIGSTPYITAELFRQVTGVNALHVPFKGDGQSLPEVMAGRIDYTFAGIPSSRQLIDAGRLRALAVTTKYRVAALPDVPSMAEAGYPAYEYTVWMGIFAPAGTAKAMVEKLNAGFRQILKLPEVQKETRAMGGEPVGSLPDEFASFVRAEYLRDGEIVKAIGLKPE